MEATKESPQALTRREAAALLGISPHTLANWAVQGRGPRFHHYSPTRTFYIRDEVESYLASIVEAGGVR
ncbi:helix-turn-helix domain-containing protein [uncultured Mobiluncus sp.]|uniref:helix-turn-helix transcriptional regulator n=1 Tax=uncultured Mobiluncus sp. TaxID=293425 RepID=UPI0034451CCD